MKYRVPKNEFADFILKTCPDDLGEEDRDDVFSRFECTTSRLRKYLHYEFGFGIDGNDIMFTDDLRGPEAIAVLVMAEYDQLGGNNYGDELIWAVFGLGGDDDVDYNGSYVLGAIEYCRAWIRSHDAAWEILADNGSTGCVYNNESDAESRAQSFRFRAKRENRDVTYTVKRKRHDKTA